MLKDLYEKAEINEIANMALVAGSTNRRLSNKKPEVYFPQVIERRGEEALVSQAITLDEEPRKIENYRQFLALRRHELARRINEFIESSLGER